ncbi:MAG: polyprenyl synthetase family protein [Sporolactobacillus sp.]
MTLAKIYRQQKKKLSVIERELKLAVTSRHPLVEQAAEELIQAGGKRIRPMLALVTAEYGDSSSSQVIDAAVTLELIHMASLVHDDVVDNSDLRRGQPTVKAKWDNRFALFTGDFIFARAIERISGLANAQAQRIVSKVIRDLSLGEIEQINQLFHEDQNLRCYLLRIKRKTALLMALSCQLGALAAGCSDDFSHRLYYFGYFIGMSFQITDDILDFVGSEQELGKPAGSDLRNGNLTLPTLYAIRGSQQIKDKVSRVLSGSADDASAWDDLIASIRTSGAIEQSEQLSERYLNKATAIVDSLPTTNRATASLRAIAAYIGDRKN